MTLGEQLNTGTSQATNHLIVRMSDMADQGRVYQFYQDNQHHHVDLRKPEVWNERVCAGRVMIIEDTEKNIGYVSVSYDFEHEGIIKWMEIGSTMSLQDPTKKPYEMIKGISLYPFIIASQVVNDFLAHTVEDKVVALLFDDNDAVINMLSKKAGWNVFTPDDLIHKAVKDTKDGENTYTETAGDIWLESTTNTIPHQARLVLQVMNEGTGEGLLNRKTGQKVGLDLSRFSLANKFRAAVEMLAHGPFADYLESQPHMGLRAARAILEDQMRFQAKPATPQCNHV